MTKKTHHVWPPASNTLDSYFFASVVNKGEYEFISNLKWSGGESLLYGFITAISLQKQKLYGRKLQVKPNW